MGEKDEDLTLNKETEQLSHTRGIIHSRDDCVGTIS